MIVEIKVPMLPESVTEATVASWQKQPGDMCAEGDVIAELETDKVMLEVVATSAGLLESHRVSEGDTVTADSILASIDTEAGSHGSDDISATEQTAHDNVAEHKEKYPSHSESHVNTEQNDGFINASPSLRREIHDKGIDITQKVPSARGGRFVAEDLTNHPDAPIAAENERVESVKRVKMSRLRAKIAQRLVDAQHTAAILTTFNEVNMAPIMTLRQDHQEAFTNKYGVKLGFMSFFVHAVTEALKDFPEVNASVDGDDILYHTDSNIGIAVSTDRGLVVPVLQKAQNMSSAEVEQSIRDYALKAREGKITLDDMSGGTFTITNGGVFGSLLSTPILNMPQSAILGMHTIQKRPVVENDEVVIRPMMYLALSYDHRLVDGKQSVGFLVRIKEIIEEPVLGVIGL
ncbi:MAG: 2-oxoglutarate dehydrogenase complex dihydrolipoyllysine-residue succinyltransferase [Pseudomonadota bacterium]|nr:2-oxoglutarate dehydrogenase complex dihydrolipoyllysine-residue succinyltransferase [Pseudomonadota bacterium]